MVDLATGLAAISALFAAVAAIANLLQARKASDGNEVSVCLGLLDSYARDEIRDAVAALAAFWRKNKHKYADMGQAFSAEMKDNEEEARKLLIQCRLIYSYFNNAGRFYEAGLVSRRVLKLIVSLPGLNVFYEVVVPIISTQNPHHNSIKYAAMLRKVVPKHGSGMY